MAEVTYKTKEELAAAHGALFQVTTYLLCELNDKTPRTIDLYEMQKHLIHEWKKGYTEGASYEKENLMMNAGIASINHFFGTIEVDGEPMPPIE